MAKATPPPPAAAPGDLKLTRVVQAPRALVWQVWTDPQHVAQWWGPHGFTNPRCELDLRIGGAMRIDMRGPDGTVYPMTGTYTELKPPERLCFTSGASDPQGQLLFEVLTTINFSEKNGRTTIHLHAQVTMQTAAAAPHLAGMAIGWNQSLDRFEAYTAQQTGRAL